MSPPTSNQQQVQNSKLLHDLRADGMRRAQEEARQEAQQPQQPHQGQRYGKMVPMAKYFDIPLVENDDLYFINSYPHEPPFSVTTAPDYFDRYETACKKDQVATLQEMISQNSLTPALLHHGLVLALAAGSLDSARELLLRGAPIARRTPFEILSAPREKKIPLLDILTSQGWKPSHELLMQSLRDAIDLDLLRWFLSHDINPNYGVKRDRPQKAGGPSYECADALEAAAGRGSVEAIEILIAAGAKIAYGSPLHIAAGARPRGFPFYSAKPSQPKDFDEKYIPVMEVLVKHGADVNEREDTPYVTPLYPILYAVEAGAVRRVRWLLEHGADPELSGRYGSAVKYATSMGSDEMKELVLSWVRAK